MAHVQMDVRTKYCDEPGCHAESVALCDGPASPAGTLDFGKTCDRRICAKHRHPIGLDRDLCPTHWIAAGCPRPRM